MSSLSTTPINLQEEYTKTEIAKILNVLDEELVGLAPVKSRIREIAEGNALATVALQGYNHRAVTVISYVAQFSLPPPCTNLEAKEQQSLHKCSSVAPNSFSRELLCRICDFTGVQPLPLFE